jgi:hypothetical protein
MSLWAWAWTHEQRSKTESFLEYSSHVDRIFKQYFVTPRTKYLVMWKNILPHVMDEWYLQIKCGWNMTMDELFHEHSQQVLFCKNLNKRNKIQEIYVGLLWTIHHMKCSSYTWISISNSITTKYVLALQHPNHIKLKIKSNLVAHKLVDPPRGMCQFKHYMSTTKRYATVRNWNNIKHSVTPYHFKSCFISFALSTPWQLAQWNYILFPLLY